MVKKSYFEWWLYIYTHSENIQGLVCMVQEYIIFNYTCCINGKYCKKCIRNDKGVLVCEIYLSLYMCVLRIVLDVLPYIYENIFLKFTTTTIITFFLIDSKDYDTTTYCLLFFFI